MSDSEASDLFYPDNPKRRAKVRALNSSCEQIVKDTNALAVHLNEVKEIYVSYITSVARLLGFSAEGVKDLVQVWHISEFKIPDKAEIDAKVAGMEKSFGNAFADGFTFGITLGIAGLFSGSAERDKLEKWITELTAAKKKLNALYESTNSQGIQMVTYGNEACLCFVNTVHLLHRMGITIKASTDIKPLIHSSIDNLKKQQEQQRAILDDPTVKNVSEAIVHLRNMLEEGMDFTAEGAYAKVEAKITGISELTLIKLWKLLKAFNSSKLKDMENLNPKQLKMIDEEIVRLQAETFMHA